MDTKNDKNERQLNPDQRLRLYLHIVDRVTSLLMLVVKAATWVAIAFSAVFVVKAVAGKRTDVGVSVDASLSFAVDMLSQFDSAKYAWAIAAFGIFYGILEREIRRKKTEYFQGRITKLEKMLDPSRESSGLTPRGETNEEDKL